MTDIFLEAERRSLRAEVFAAKRDLETRELWSARQVVGKLLGGIS